MTHVLSLENVSCGYGGKPVVEGLDFALEAGNVCALLGPNGVGKTTLFKSILGTLPLIEGAICLQGDDANKLSRTEIAKRVGYVPQGHRPPFSYTVVEVVEMGRTAHLGLTAVPSREDRVFALACLNQLGIAYLHDKPYTHISGGERQLVLIARALCQDTPLLLMDEPCANLDFGNAARVMGVLGQLAHEGISVLVSTHDPSHVLRYTDSVVALLDSEEFVVGAPRDVVDDALLYRMYGVRAAVGSLGDVPVAVPL